MIRNPLRLAWLWYLAGILLLFGVAILSLIQLPPGGPQVNDKLTHLLVYALLSGWFSILARQLSALIWVIAGLIAYGILIELLQSLTAYRQAEWGDVMANSAGVLLGIGLHFTPAMRILEILDRRLGLFFLRE